MMTDQTLPQRFEYHLMPGLALVIEGVVTILRGDGPRRDPDWSYLDAQGHRHDAKLGFCVEVEDQPAFMDADGEEWNAETHYECQSCREVIVPGVLDGPWTEIFEWPRSYALALSDYRHPLGLSLSATAPLSRDACEALMAAKPEERASMARDMADRFVEDTLSR